MISFYLTKEVWLPCSDLEGQLSNHSLITIFQQAHQLQDLEADNPLMQAALYRFLLAILHRVHDGPKGSREWKQLWRRKKFNADLVTRYLEQWQTRFDLFSGTTPFYQTVGFEGKSGSSPVNKLFHELTSANNKTQFDHTLDANPPRLTPAQAASALIMFQAYAFGGGISASSNLFAKHPNFTHGPLLKGVCVFLQGNNLFETLLLNALPFYDAKASNQPIPRLREEPDLPVWERDDIKRLPTTYTPRGYLEYLTWYSRHVRLLPEEQDGEIFVSRLYLAQADAVAGHVRDPFFVLMTKREEDKKDKAPEMPLKLSADKALWRDSSSLFLYKHTENADSPSDLCPTHIAHANDISEDIAQLEQLSLHVIGLGLPKDGKPNPKLWRSEILPISPDFLLNEALPTKLKNALVYAENIGKVLNKYTFVLAKELQTAGTRDPDAKLVNKTVQNLKTTHLFWSRMEPLFQNYLQQLKQSTELDTVQQDWFEKTTKLAKKIFEQATQNCQGYTAREIRARAMTLENFNYAVNIMWKKEKPDENLIKDKAHGN